MGKPKYSDRNLSQYHLVYHRYPMYWPGIDPRIRCASVLIRQTVHCTYNVRLRRVRATIVAVENQYVLVHILSVCL
jgi:hypothetical protein